VIDSLNGARASAIIYSIAETAKANNLKSYEYFKYLYEELPKSYMYQKSSDYDRLLPWFEELPKDCHRTMK